MIHVRFYLYELDPVMGVGVVVRMGKMKEKGMAEGKEIEEIE